MCYVPLTAEEQQRRGRELTADEWLAIAQEARSRGMLFLLLTGGAQNRHRPMVVAVDGSLFRNSALLHPAVNEELDRFLVQKLQRYCVCKPISNASAVGAAAAALLQG